MRSFCGPRLALARKRNGLTKRKLSDLSGVSAKTISNWEKYDGTENPSETGIRKIATALKYPIDFFYAPDFEELKFASANFRARTKMTQNQRDKSLAAGEFALMYYRWMDKNFELPSNQLFVVDEDCPDPVAVARALRQEWGLGIQPIPNIVNLLESRGVRVFSLKENSVNVDAFSFWSADGLNAFIMLNTEKSGERSRMDAAHELGHLVMHRAIDSSSSNRKLEDEANDFAAEFLMPEQDIIGRAPRGAFLGDYIEAKKIWKVSLASLIYRVNRLGLISRWQYQSLFKQMSAKGMRTKEPNGIDLETSQIIKKVFDLLKEKGSAPVEISKEMLIPYHEIVRLSFGPSIELHHFYDSGATKIQRSSSICTDFEIIKN